MSLCSTELFLLLLFMISLQEISSKKKMIISTDAPKMVHVKRSYANLLNSLIKVNEERVTALKKLYVLNSVTYGKDVLRSSIRNKLDDYDKMQDRLTKTLKRVLDNLERQAPKQSITESDIHEILHKHDHIFVLPLEGYRNKEARNEDTNALRNKDSDANDKSDEDSSKSTSSEKLDEEEFKEFRGNNTQDRSYYYYGCGRGRLRCIKACKEAYRDACVTYFCKSSLRKSLRSACKSECKAWFY